MSAFWGCVAAAIIVMALAAPAIAPDEPLKSEFRAMSYVLRTSGQVST
jgi:hypothetical protein